MKIVLDLPDDEDFSPHELSEMTAEISGMTYKVSVFTRDRKLTPMTQLLMERDK